MRLFHRILGLFVMTKNNNRNSQECDVDRNDLESIVPPLVTNLQDNQSMKADLSAVNQIVLSIFEYLKAVKDLQYPVIKDFREYDNHWWQSELPQDESVRLMGDCRAPDAWLEVDKTEIPKSPRVPSQLDGWLIGSPKDFNNLPGHHDTRSLLTAKELEELAGLEEVIASITNKIKANEKKHNETKDSVEREQMAEIIAIDQEKLDTYEYRWLELEEKREVKFIASKARVNAWEVWIDQWKAWQRIAIERNKSQILYGEMFALHHRMKREGDELEIFWGHGLLSWKGEKTTILHPVIITDLELDFQPKIGRFSLRTGANPPSLELDYLQDVPIKRMESLAELRSHLREKAIKVFNERHAKPFFTEFLNNITPDGIARYDRIYTKEEIDQQANPHLYHSPVIIIRKKAQNLWQRELNSVIEYVESGNFIPKTITSFATDEITPDEPDEERRWSSTAEEILFPLSSNDEQREIVRRLSRSCGVAVQGPLGTGKSHTIVNLIAHYLAHGKRILVTSHKAGALRVLNTKIKNDLPAIAPLCVSLLGNSLQSAKELERSVNGILKGLSNDDQELATRITNSQEHLAAAKSDEARVLNQIVQLNNREYLKCNLLDKKMSIVEVADWLLDNEKQFGWLPDKICDAAEMPLSDGELRELFHLAVTVSDEHRQIAKQELPAIHNLPNEEEIRLLFETISSLRDSENDRNQELANWDVSNPDKDKINEAQEYLQGVIKLPKTLADNWLCTLFKEIGRGESFVKQWSDFAHEVTEYIKEILLAKRKLDHFRIEIPQNVVWKKFQDDLDIIHGELTEPGKISVLWSKIRNSRRTRYIFEKCSLNGQPPGTADDISILIKFTENRQRIARLVAFWNNRVAEIEGPIFSEDQKSLLSLIEENRKHIQLALSWHGDQIQPIKDLLGGFSPRFPQNWTNLDFLERINSGIACYLNNLHYGEIQSRLGHIVEYLETGVAKDKAADQWTDLLSAAHNVDFPKWREAVSTLSGKAVLNAELARYRELIHQLSQIAPLWAASIQKPADSDGKIEYPADWADAWQWSKVSNWFHEHAAGPKLIDAFRELKNIRTRIAQVTIKLIAKSTWSQLIKSIKPAQRSALVPFIKEMSAITRSGRGAYDAQRRAAARKHMKKCRPAVPVWIMPISRVLESIPPDSEKFDLLIIDESSQCDLYSLSLLLRAKRVLIVGDDKQVSPPIGRDIANTFYQQSERFLQNVPNASEATWGARVSLYDKAYEIFSKLGSTWMLCEHFRCAPDIITWSNDLFYHGEIRPLRVPTPQERFEQPLIAEYIPDGYWRDDAKRDINFPEAKAIVKKIKQLCGDPAYENRTIGVIALQGGMDQALAIQELLMKEVPAREIEKRRIICGDAKDFQGDERDVIFLSMVVAPNSRYQALTKKDAKQRFNVAVTRARDQIWLFHSVTLEDVAKNPEDLRYQLLNYIKNRKRIAFDADHADEIMDKYNSGPFHREIYRQIIIRGYRAIPEFHVGKRRIDIVIEGRTTQIAVECDGDTYHTPANFHEDLKRQLELERAGFTFWRIRYSEYRRAPETALEPLWDLLNSMRIGTDGTDLPKQEGPERSKKSFETEIPSSDDETSLLPDQANNVRPSQSKKSTAVKTVPIHSADKNQKKKTTAKKKKSAIPNTSTNRSTDALSTNEIKSAIVQILSDAPNNTFMKEKIHTAVLKTFAINTRGKPREDFKKRINRILGQLKAAGTIDEYKRKNIRVRLIDTNYPILL